VRKEPFLLSTQVHFTQGAVEIADVRYDGATRTLDVSLNDLGQRRGVLLFYFPESVQYYDIQAASPTDQKWEKVDRHILAVEVSFDGSKEQRQEWNLHQTVFLKPDGSETERVRRATITASVPCNAGVRREPDALLDRDTLEYP
jgi:hypothetical protein